MIETGRVVVHRNSASPFPMYFYALEEHNDPEIEELPSHPGFWYGFYILQDFLALQVMDDWLQFYPLTIQSGRRFVVDVGLPMYVSLNEGNIIETFVTTKREQKSINSKMRAYLYGNNKVYAPTQSEISFLYHPEYLVAFNLTKRAQGLEA